MTSDVAVPFTLGSAAPVLGTALHPVMSSAAMVTMVGIDSRAMGEGGLFVPLPGRFTDGHAFVKSALDGGALAALVAESQAESVFASIPDDQHSRLLIVDDPLEALHRLARWYLSERGDIQKIAVTGSNGKTTTKECIASILAQEFSVFKTAGNYNSVIGVPLALFGIKDEHAYVVCELAMSEKGEMSKLAALLSPDLAVITNIGTAHIGNLGSQDDIAVEKKAVFSCFSGRQLAFIAEDDAYYDFLSQGIAGTVVPFGEVHTPGISGVEENGLDGTLIYWDGMEINLPVPGRHNVMNTAAAISVAMELGVSPEAVKRGIESLQLPFGRGQIIRGEVSIIQDCYNANPQSMRAALEFFASLAWKGRKVAVLGDMLELGSETRQQHVALVSEVRAYGFDRVYWVGENLAGQFTGAELVLNKNEFAGPGVDDIADDLCAYTRPGDLLLLKGSRGIGLEKCSELLLAAPVCRGGIGC